MSEIIVFEQGQIEVSTAQQGLIDLVCNGVTSEHTKRAYKRALSDFLNWHNEQGQPALCKATIQRYKAYMQELGFSAASINQRLSAIRKLALEASDNGLISEQISNGIKNVSGLRQEGQRSGNWLTREQAQNLLNTPNSNTLKGCRDRAILAILLGCGLRREELSRLTWNKIQQREGRWVIVDIIGKRGKVRSVPMPSWAKYALDEYKTELAIKTGQFVSEIDEGLIFVSINRGDNISGDSLTSQAVRDIVTSYTDKLGYGEVAPHDLRRTFAKLAKSGGSDLEQIQLSLGHSSIVTTQRYLGTKQTLNDAPCDRLGLSIE